MAAGLWSVKSPQEYWITSRNSTSRRRLRASTVRVLCARSCSRRCRAVFAVRPRAPDWTWPLAADPPPAASPRHRRAPERDGLKGGAAGADAGDLRRTLPRNAIAARGDGRDHGCANTAFSGCIPAFAVRLMANLGLIDLGSRLLSNPNEFPLGTGLGGRTRVRRARAATAIGQLVRGDRARGDQTRRRQRVGRPSTAKCAFR
jgi:hypothetical protein